jgi:hypothetical protein
MPSICTISGRLPRLPPGLDTQIADTQIAGSGHDAGWIDTGWIDAGARTGMECSLE